MELDIITALITDESAVVEMNWAKTSDIVASKRVATWKKIWEKRILGLWGKESFEKGA